MKQTTPFLEGESPTLTLNLISVTPNISRYLVQISLRRPYAEGIQFYKDRVKGKLMSHFYH